MCPPLQSVQATVVLFTVVFVLLTLLVNAPMLTWVLRWTGLSLVPPQHVKMRKKAVQLLAKHTEQTLQELRDDEGEMLRGAGSSYDRVYPIPSSCGLRVRFLQAYPIP